eukprot:943747-Prymnesium_polylepis.1
MDMDMGHAWVTWRGSHGSLGAGRLGGAGRIMGLPRPPSTRHVAWVIYVTWHGAHGTWHMAWTWARAHLVRHARDVGHMGSPGVGHARVTWHGSHGTRHMGTWAHGHELTSSATHAMSSCNRCSSAVLSLRASPNS